MGMIDERHDVPTNVTPGVTVEFFLKDKPGVQEQQFTNRWEAERFFLVMMNDPMCETVHIRRPR